MTTRAAPAVPPRTLVSACVSRPFLDRIPRDFARRHLIISQGCVDDVETLAVSSSTSPAARLNTQARLGRAVSIFIAEDESIARIIDEAYAEVAACGNPADEPPATEESEIDQLLAEADRDLLSTEGKGPIIKLVDVLLFEALGRRASDVHIQPLEERTLIRYRLDGVLHTAREIPRGLTCAVISRVKVMGRMDIAERRAPQDGRATVMIGSGSAGRSIDLRISTLPTSYGERAVIRLLDNSQQLSQFDQLGMPADLAEQFLDIARRSNGMVLVTGPTGSGKTTTLYATLRSVGHAGVNIMTVEDPIEYELSTTGLAISQSQVNPQKGVTFATGLRHILRQDPDVVMVGEIRDAETARIAIQSSLTGHLVFSTLHTNDAASAMTRLIDLGVEPYLVSASLAAVLAQRLLRTTHKACAGDGCAECFGTGYAGRTGVFELLCMDQAMSELVSRNAPVNEIRSQAIRSGARTLRQAAEALVASRRTTWLELQRVVHGEAESVDGEVRA